MKRQSRPGAVRASRGFTLIELMTAALILALLGAMSYRALGVVLDARTATRLEADKWRRVGNFMERFERDLGHAGPRSVRTGDGQTAAWLGRSAPETGAVLEISRLGGEGMEGGASAAGGRRLAYRRAATGEIELLLWPALDAAPGVQPARHAVLSGVTRFDLQYLNAAVGWVNAWPSSSIDASLPRAVRLAITLASGEDIVRVFALGS